MTVEYRIDLEAFGGPMDLLLHLVKKNEIDIYDIPIAVVLEQFLDHLRLLTELDVDGVGEFLVMASTLMEIKSRMLVPSPVSSEDEVEEDPRTDLVRQLLDYKRFREIADELEDRRREQARRFPRGSTGDVAATDEEDEPRLSLDEITLWDLCAAYSKILHEIELAAGREVVFDDTPIEDHMHRIVGGLRESGVRTFRSLFPQGADRGVLVGMFIALLELVRERAIRVFQDEDFGEIKIVLREPADEPRTSTRADEGPQLVPAEPSGNGAPVREAPPFVERPPHDA